MPSRPARGDDHQPPAVPPDLSMVVLSVRDMAALRHFYRSLGWEELAGASDQLSMFRLGGVSLALHPAGGPTNGRPADIDSPAVAADHPPATLVIRVTSVGAVDTATSSAEQAGARVVSGLEDHPWGGRSAVVADPEGNRWELLWVASPRSTEPDRPPGPG